MKRELTNAFGKVFLTIEADTTFNIIRARWQGYISEANVKVGAKALSEMLSKTGLNCILADMLSVLGPIRTSGWGATVWAPQAAKEGLKYMALLKEPDSIANADIELFHSTQSGFKSAIFSRTRDAENWLVKQCRTILV